MKNVRLCLLLAVIASLLLTAIPSQGVASAEQMVPPSLVKANFSQDGGEWVDEFKYWDESMNTMTYLAADANQRMLPDVGALSTVSMSTADLPPYAYAGVQVWAGPGTFHGGQAASNALVDDIDGDGDLEVVFTGLATGPVYAGHHDGTQVAGWPDSNGTGAGYCNMTQFDESPEMEVFCAYWGGEQIARLGDGSVMPGWPRTGSNFHSTPFSAWDVDGDSTDEVFGGEEDWSLHGYNGDGTVVAGWPVWTYGSQELHTPMMTGDGRIYSTSGSTTSGVKLEGFNPNGTSIAGYPRTFSKGLVDTFLAGWFEEDELNTVFVAKENSYPWDLIVHRLDDEATTQWTAYAPTVPYGTAPVVADLDCDNDPEIMIQTEDRLTVLKSDGSIAPEWPRIWNDDMYWLNNASPVVGDVNGDGWPDVVVVISSYSYLHSGYLRIFDRNGEILYNVELPNLGGGGVPYVGDLDGDGTTEIIVICDYWDGNSGYKDKVYFFRFPNSGHSSPPQWSQFGHDSKHTGIWTPQECNFAPNLTMTKSVKIPRNPAEPGDVLTFTITISNTGTTANDVSVIDNLPEPLLGTDLSWTGTITSGSELTWVITTTVGEFEPRTFGQIITNTASYSYTLGSGEVSANFTVANPRRLYLPLALKGE